MIKSIGGEKSTRNAGKCDIFTKTAAVAETPGSLRASQGKRFRASLDEA
jgi:hypothetical protein